MAHYHLFRQSHLWQSSPDHRQVSTKGRSNHMADAGCVKVSHEGPVAVLSMEFAPHNLLGLDLMAGMRAGLQEAQDKGARAILLKSGLRHFSAGADTSLFGDALEGGKLSASPLEFLRDLEACPLPIVAAVQGVCVGGGLEI